MARVGLSLSVNAAGDPRRRMVPGLCFEVIVAKTEGSEEAREREGLVGCDDALGAFGEGQVARYGPV